MASARPNLLRQASSREYIHAAAGEPPADCIDREMWKTATNLLHQHAVVRRCTACAAGLCPNGDMYTAGLDVARGQPSRQDDWWWQHMQARHPFPIRMITPPTTDPARVHPTLAGYLETIEEHCKPVQVARQSRHLLLSSFQPRHNAAADVFANICAAAEGVRIRRRNGAGPYACAGLVFLGTAAVQHQDDLISHPAHLARCLYAPAGLVIAALQPGPPRPGRNGQPVPGPAVSLIVIRPGLPEGETVLQAAGSDRRLLPADADDYRDVIASALDLPPKHLVSPREAYRRVERWVLATTLETPACSSNRVTSRAEIETEDHT